MADTNFLRTYTMKCGRMGEAGFEIGNVKDAKETVLHVSFSVEKSDAESANTAKVQVWNLSDQNLKILDGKDCIVELKAGYGGKNALILAGNITNVVTTPDNADRMTEIDVVDGRVELRDTVLSVSFNGMVDSRSVYEYIAEQMGVTIVFAEDLEFMVFPNGFSFVGQARTAIPKRITIGAKGKTEEPQTGWEVECLLNGAIGINDIVQLESRMARGYFRVHKITFDGDNLEGDWMCTMELLEIKAQAQLDALAGGA